MPVFTRTPDARDGLIARSLLIPATLLESLGAAFDDPVLSPLELAQRQAEIAEASGIPSAFDALAATRARRGDISPRGAERIARFGVEPADNIPEPEQDVSGLPVDLITAEEANEQFGGLGLKFDKPIPRRVAELIAEGRAEEIARADIIERAPQGLIPGALRLGASFARAAIDPLNIAAAFIPIVSQARFAGFVARGSSLTAARIRAGAIEGAVGNALIEPVVGVLANQQQLDYEMSDALVNIAFGAVLGAGLHVGIGKISDRLAGFTGAEREAILRAAVAQGVAGRTIDVDPIVRTRSSFLDPDRVFSENEGRIPSPLPARQFDRGRVGSTGRFASYTPVGPQDRIFIEGVVQELLDTHSGQRFFIETEGQGSTPEILGLPASTPEWFQFHNRAVKAEQSRIKKIRKANATLPNDRKIPVPITPSILTRNVVQTVSAKMLKREPLAPREIETAELIFEVARERRVENVNQMVEFRRVREEEIDALVASELQDVAVSEGLPERDMTADFEASREADEALSAGRTDPDNQTLDDDLEFLDGQIAILRQSDSLDEADIREVGRIDEAVGHAEAIGRAAKAAAVCLGRTG